MPHDELGYFLQKRGDFLLITLQQLKSALQAVKSYITSVTPTKTSDLTNDSGYITNAGVTSYNGATGAVISPWVDGTGTNSAKTRSAASANGTGSVAEGSGTQATGNYSHSEGGGTTASGNASHAEGNVTTASGQYSHAEGSYTTAASDYQHVQGKYNISDSNGTYAHIVGGGTSTSARANIHTLDWNGNAVYSGKVTVGTAPSASMDVATKEYVDTAVSSVESPPEIFIGSTTPSGYTMYIDPEGMVENARGVSF